MKHHQSTTSSPRQSTVKKAIRSVAKNDVAAQGLPSGAGHDEMVRQTAYAYYEERGCIDGHDLEDWLKAEAQIARTFAVAAQSGASPGH